jgi:hypothetical protein
MRSCWWTVPSVRASRRWRIRFVREVGLMFFASERTRLAITTKDTILEHLSDKERSD